MEIATYSYVIKEQTIFPQLAGSYTPHVYLTFSPAQTVRFRNKFSCIPPNLS